MRHSGFAKQDIKITIQKIEEINCTRDQQGLTRRGIPVAQDTLFWLLADLVLRPVDELLSQDQNIPNYCRWVDDFFIAVEPSSDNYALEALSTALAPLGLELNRHKTHTVASLDEFDHHTLTFEHRIVTSLMMTAIHGPLSESQLDAFIKLVESDRIHSIEHARLWKRIYVLAAKLRSPRLANKAFTDLDAYPTIEKQVLLYLHKVGWPRDTLLCAINQLVRAPTDSQAITILKALLLAILSEREVDISALQALATSNQPAFHPYAQVLLQACLVFQCSNTQTTVAQRLLSSTRDLSSPMARRLALNLLWSIPETRNLAKDRAIVDDDYTVGALTSQTNVVANNMTDRNCPRIDPFDTPILTNVSLNAELRTAFSRYFSGHRE